MQTLTVHKLITGHSSITTLSKSLDALEQIPIKQQPWPQFAYKPNVSFAIGYTARSIIIKYQVAENEVRALNTMPNSPVYEDSCVEAFIAFDDTGYYNFEFNCLGTALAGFGSGRTDRTPLDTTIISQIQSTSTFTRTENGIYNWTLALNIPFTVFVHHNIKQLEGTQCRANFYKCGDLLPKPHFLSWTAIDAPEPNFHLPEFFGTLQFNP